MVRVYKDFSVHGYEDWSFMICMYLKAPHILMWDVFENGPTPIYNDKVVEVKGMCPRKATYTRKLKNLHDYSKVERNEDDCFT